MTAMRHLRLAKQKRGSVNTGEDGCRNSQTSAISGARSYGYARVMSARLPSVSTNSTDISQQGKFLREKSSLDAKLEEGNNLDRDSGLTRALT
jgi:hypothetical protein